MNSMTGFGVARGQWKHSRFVVEARSVNHRFCEVSFRFPGKFSSLESEVTRRIRAHFSRGKFDLFLREENVGFAEEEIERARRTLQVLKKIQKELGLKGEIQLSEVMTFRGVLFPLYSSNGDHEAAGKFALRLMDEALKDLRKTREREGERIKRWFGSRLRTLLRRLDSIEKHSLKGGVDVRRRLQKKWKGFKNLEEGRMAQEAAVMTDRTDVTEEIVRLRSHLQEFGKFLLHHEPVGRRFDFLIQEMGREINTIGSKSQGVRLAHEVIEFKSELERIREQVQNVE